MAERVVVEVVLDTRQFDEQIKCVGQEMERLQLAAEAGKRAMIEWGWVYAIATAGEYVVTTRLRWWHRHRIIISRSMPFGMADEAIWQARQAGFRRLRLRQVSSPWR